MSRNLISSTVWMIYLSCLPLVGAQDRSIESFVLGADISFYDQLGQAGVMYSEDGMPGELLDILKDNGINTIRLRLWHTPQDPWNSLERTLVAAQRAHEAGLDILLDIHYSDTWADPGKQTKPAAWNGLPFDALTDSVRSYTHTVLSRLNSQGTVPAYVQIGNEISVGMLWDDGRVGGRFDTPAQWSKLSTLLNAAIASVHEVFLMRKGPLSFFIRIMAGIWPLLHGSSVISRMKRSPMTSLVCLIIPSGMAH